MWSLELKTNSIQKDVGSLIGVNWGAVVNRTYVFGIGVAANLSHNVTNYSYFHLVAQYIPEADKLLHYGGQIGFGFGTVKDYEHAKTNMLDNFLNTSGTAFYFVEPQLNAELNVTTIAKLVLGLSYSLAFGLNEQNHSIAKSRVTNQDLSGVNVTIGVKLGRY
ncbi:MAG TPA: hypothetical protein VIS48_08330 [Candidatus Kryptonia bacterium]